MSGPDWLVRFVSYLETQNGQRVAICAFSIAATLVLLTLPGGALAYLFGIPFMFFIPGFALVRMFFWKGTTPEAKFVLSIGISIVVVILLGLILVLTPIGLDSTTTRSSLVIFALAAVAIETFWLRSDRETETSPQQITQRTTKQPRADKVVVAMLATALVVSAISLGLIVTAKYPSRTYFALTDEEGMIISNASWVEGTNLTLLLHMKNGESGDRNFTMLAYGVSKGWVNTSYYATQTYARVLEKGQLWNQTVSFNLTDAGFSRLDFDLYIQSGQEPPYLYGNLHLWVRVLLPWEASSATGSSIASSESPLIDMIAVSRTAAIADETALAMLITTVPTMSKTSRLVL